jgi:hypothetical protein
MIGDAIIPQRGIIGKAHASRAMRQGGGMSKQIIFLSGAAMDPQAIRASYPAARFLARAQVTAVPGEISPFFGRTLVGRGESGTIWGVAVETDAAIDGPAKHATTDEGQSLEVVVAEQPLVGGDPEAALNAALYWELPPAYTTLLREAAGVALPEAEGGWETMSLQQPENGASISG